MTCHFCVVPNRYLNQCLEYYISNPWELIVVKFESKYNNFHSRKRMCDDVIMLAMLLYTPIYAIAHVVSMAFSRHHISWHFGMTYLINISMIDTLQDRMIKYTHPRLVNSVPAWKSLRRLLRWVTNDCRYGFKTMPWHLKRVYLPYGWHITQHKIHNDILNLRNSASDMMNMLLIDRGFETSRGLAVKRPSSYLTETQTCFSGRGSGPI